MKVPGFDRQPMFLIDCMDEYYTFGQPHLYVLNGDFADIRLRKPVPTWFARLVCGVKGRHLPSQHDARCRRCGTTLEKMMGEYPPQHGLFRREVIGPVECPILIRWTILNTRFGKLLVHRFMPNADDRAVHDHPAPFWTLVLKGGYDDMVPCEACDGEGVLLRDVHGNLWKRRALEEDAPILVEREQACPVCRDGLKLGDRMRRGTIRYRPARHRHRTHVLPVGALTLVVMGAKQQSWGFFRDGRKWPWQEFEATFGAGMRCPDVAELREQYEAIPKLWKRYAPEPSITVEKYGAVVELREDGWYRNGELLPAELAAEYEAALGVAMGDPPSVAEAPSGWACMDCDFRTTDQPEARNHAFGKDHLVVR